MSITLKFKCKIDETSIEVEANTDKNFIYIEVVNPDNDLINLHLDKPTAIKLSKELRKQIALIN